MEYYREITNFLQSNIKNKDNVLIEWTIIEKPNINTFIILFNDTNSEKYYLECLIKNIFTNEYKIIRHSIIINYTNSTIHFSGELLFPPKHPFILDSYIYKKYPEYEFYCKHKLHTLFMIDRIKL
jgi:hypothetical protein